MKHWDHYEYKIAGHYLSAMINNDFSGMTDEETAEYKVFEREAFDNARADGFIIGHWADVVDSGENWGLCEVSGLHAMRCTVLLMVYKEKV